LKLALRAQVPDWERLYADSRPTRQGNAPSATGSTCGASPVQASQSPRPDDTWASLRRAVRRAGRQDLVAPRLPGRCHRDGPARIGARRGM